MTTDGRLEILHNRWQSFASLDGESALLYLLLKSLHIVAVITWMGGMVLLSAGFLWLREAACPRSGREMAVLSSIKR